MPFLEETNLLNIDDLTLGVAGAAWYSNDGAAYRTFISGYLCPSDTRGTVVFPGEATNGWTRSNYVACFSADGGFVEPGVTGSMDGYFNLPAYNPSVASGNRALFNINVLKRIRNVTDGLSHTAAFSELIAGIDGSPDIRGYWWGWFGDQYTHARTPNSTTWDELISGYCDATKVPCLATAQWSTVKMAARSYHVGNVNVAIADGSVRTVGDEIDPSVWQALASIASGENLPADF